MVAVIDLIDEEGLKDSIIQKKKLGFEMKLAYCQDVRDGKVSFESQDDGENAMYQADEMLDNMSDVQFLNGSFDEYCYFTIHENMDAGSANTTEFRSARSFLI